MGSAASKQSAFLTSKPESMRDAILSIAAFGLVILATFSFAGNEDNYFGSYQPEHKTFAELQQNFSISNITPVDSPTIPKPDTLPKPMPIPVPDTLPHR